VGALGRRRISDSDRGWRGSACAKQGGRRLRQAAATALSSGPGGPRGHKERGHLCLPVGLRSRNGKPQVLRDLGFQQQLQGIWGGAGSLLWFEPRGKNLMLHGR